MGNSNIARGLQFFALIYIIASFVFNIEYSKGSIPKEDTNIVYVVSTSPDTMIQYSDAVIKNNLTNIGVFYGWLNGERTETLGVLNSMETISLKVGGYDSLEFYFETLNSPVKSFYRRVRKNLPFSKFPVSVIKVEGFRMEADDRGLKKLFGKELYEIIIEDDVDPKRILVASTASSAKYIDVSRLDTIESVRWQIRLKKANDLKTLSEKEKKQLNELWNKGKGLDVSVEVSENQNPEQKPEKYTVFLKRKK